MERFKKQRKKLMGNPVPVVNLETYENFLSNIENIVDIYNDVGVVVLRGHNFSDEEHKNAARSLGGHLKWNMFHGAEAHTESAFYDGGHSDLQDEKTYFLKQDEYLLDWHIEQVYYVKPILAGLWNMYHFSAPQGSGNTQFMDSCKLYELLADEDKELLSNSIIYWKKQSHTGSGPYYTRAVAPHPTANKPTIRVETDRGCEVPPLLYLLNNEEPSEAEKTKFNDVVEYIKLQLNSNKELLYVHEWEEGDLLVVDLFRMYHSVKGGFARGERKFKGLAMRPEVYNHDLHESLETLWEN